MQFTMTHSELADLIVMDVRRHAHCIGFKSFSVQKVADSPILGTNWSGANVVDYGEADEKVCNDVLREVIPRMQRQYRLS
jgi:hypothetical protein